jgi:hypothetical protein
MSDAPQEWHPWADYGGSPDEPPVAEAGIDLAGPPCAGCRSWAESTPPSRSEEEMPF